MVNSCAEYPNYHLAASPGNPAQHPNELNDPIVKTQCLEQSCIFCAAQLVICIQTTELEEDFKTFNPAHN